MADNTFKTVFEIAGELDASFPASFRKAVSEIEKVNKSLKISPQNMQALDKAASKTLSTIGKMAAGGSVLASAFFLAADAIAQADMKVQSLSQSVGMTVKDAEALGASVAPMGFDFETVVDMREEFINKWGESKSIFEQLVADGISEEKALDKVVGGMKDSYKMMGMDIADALKKSEDVAFKEFVNATLKHGNNAEAQSASDIMMGGEANRVTGSWRAQDYQSLDEITKKFNALNIRSDESRENMMAFATAMNSLKFFVGNLTKEFFGLVGGAMTPLIESMSAWAVANKDLIASNVAEFATSVGNAFKFIADNWETIKDVSRFAFNFIATIAALTLALKAFRAVVTLVNLAMAMNPFVAVGLAVMALIAGVVALVQHFGGFAAIWERVKGWFKSGGDAIASTWQSIKDKTIGAFTAVIGFFRSWMQGIDTLFANNPILNFIFPIIGIPRIIVANWSSISSFFASVWSSISGVVSAGVSFVFGIVSSVFNSIAAFISSVWARITAIISGAWNGLVSVIVNSGLYNGIVNVWNTIISFLSGLGSKMMNIGRNIIDGLINGVLAGFDKLKSIWNTVNSYIPDFAKKKMDIHSPSRVMAEIGGHITAGLGVGIESGQSGLKSSMNNTIGTLTNTATPFSSNNQSQQNTPQSAAVTLVQHITVGSADAYSAAKSGAAEGVKNFKSEYDAMMRKQARTAY